MDEEEKNEPGFAAELAQSCGADVYVNDAFGAAHRAHASTAGVVPHVTHAVAGLLEAREVALDLVRARGDDGRLVAHVGELGAGEMFATILEAAGSDHKREYHVGARPIPLVNPGIKPVSELIT